MKDFWKILYLSGLIFASAAAAVEPSPTPTVLLRGNTISIDGRYTHIKGEMPAKGETWYYHVELKEGTDLFVFTFWTIDEFQDTQEENYGSYRAKAWTVQVLDSEKDPEERVIFDHLNDFIFWGDVVNKEDHAEVTIDTIEGLPEGTYRGPVTLEILQQQRSVKN